MVHGTHLEGYLRASEYESWFKLAVCETHETVTMPAEPAGPHKPVVLEGSASCHSVDVHKVPCWIALEDACIEEPVDSIERSGESAC